MIFKKRGYLRLITTALCLTAFIGLSLAGPLGGQSNILSSITPTAAASDVTTKTIAAGTSYATTMYIIDSGKSGPVVMVTGGVHGNEPAGYQAAKVVKNFGLKKGKLIVIPEANRRAVLNKTRTYSGIGDLNRSFPTSSTGKPDDVLARAIWQVVKDYKVTWLMDLHEGYNYYRVNKSSVGQTIIYYPNGASQTVANNVASALKKTVSSSSRYFTVLRYPAIGSLARSTGQYLGVHSFILETCSKQSLSVRVNQHVTGVTVMLQYLGMR